MRVAYLLPPLSKPNGWRNHATGFLRAMRRHVEPVLLVAEEDAQAAASLFPEHERFVLPVIQYAFHHNGRLARLAASLAALQRLSLPQVALVHALEAYPAGLLGYWLARRLRVPYLLTIHGTYGVLPVRSSLHRLLYSRVLQHAGALCPVSPETGAQVAAHFPAAAARVAMRPILNGNDYYQTVRREEASQRQPRDCPSVLSVGAIKPRKGQLLSLQAFARLKQRLPAARFRIVGEVAHTAYYRRLQDWIAQERLADVEFLGAVPEACLHQCYREAAVFLLTPQQAGLHFEGFGLVILEAGAFGLPVVAARSGGVASAIRPGQTGLVAEPDDVPALAEALYQILSDPALARRMGLANREWAETLTWEKNASEHFRLYQEIIPGFDRLKQQ
jgi:phosphatidylinositol alpha-1,6-mannosyltransferase